MYFFKPAYYARSNYGGKGSGFEFKIRQVFAVVCSFYFVLSLLLRFYKRNYFVLGILFHLEFLITAKFTTNYKGMKTETKHL